MERHLFLQLMSEALPLQQNCNLPEPTKEGIHIVSFASSCTQPIAAINHRQSMDRLSTARTRKTAFGGLMTAYGAYGAQFPAWRDDKKARRVLWYPTQAKNGLEWGTQPSLPVKLGGTCGFSFSGRLFSPNANAAMNSA
jgi:hypothetical protein